MQINKMYITYTGILWGHDSDTLHGQCKILYTNRISRKSDERVKSLTRRDRRTDVISSFPYK